MIKTFGRRGSVTILPVVVVFASVAAFLGVLYYALPVEKPASVITNVLVNENSNVNTVVEVNTNTVVNTNTTVDETKGWGKYTNTTYNFSLRYPATHGVLSDHASEKVETTSHITVLNSQQETQIDPKNNLDFRPRLEVEVQPLASGQTLLEATTALFEANQNKGYTTDVLTETTWDKNKNTIFTFHVNHGFTDGEGGWTLYPEQVVILTVHNSNIIRVIYPRSDLTLHTIFTTLTFTIPTADWKTFTNTKYFYTLRLNPDWQPLSELDGSVITGLTNTGNSYLFGKPGSKGSFGFTVSALTMGKIVEGYPNSLKQWRENKSIRSEVDVTLGSATFKKITLTDDPTIWYLSEHDQYFYEIRVQEDPSTIVDQMLSTFTFTK